LIGTHHALELIIEIGGGWIEFGFFFFHFVMGFFDIGFVDMSNFPGVGKVFIR
jgi:hypothetical protein